MPASYMFFARAAMCGGPDAVACVSTGKRFGVAFALAERSGAQSCEFQMLALGRRIDGSVAVFGNSTPMHASGDTLSINPALDLFATVSPNQCDASVFERPSRVLVSAGCALQALLAHYMQPSGLRRSDLESITLKCLSVKALPTAEMRGVLCGL